MTYGERGTKKLENGKEKETRTRTEGKKENIIEKNGIACNKINYNII